MSKSVFQFTGLSGAGKSTLSLALSRDLMASGLSVAILDGDELRKTISADLGFSQLDRLTHLKRVAHLATTMEADVVLIAVINPYEQGRQLFKQQCSAKLIWLNCPLAELKKRDTKGLYRRAYLPDEHPEKLANLTGVNAPFEEPQFADLIVDTDCLSIEESTNQIANYILNQITSKSKVLEF